MSIPRKHVDWETFDQHKASGGTDADFAKRYGIDPRNFPQYKKSRHLDEPTIADVPMETVDLVPTSNGNLPAIPSAHSNAPERISALPVHYDASELDDVKSRVATLEAFMAVLQEQQRISALPAHQNAPAHRSAPERTEPPTWVSRGMHVSTDMLAAIDAYATQRRLEKRMALDELLRIAFAAVAEEVHADA